MQVFRKKYLYNPENPIFENDNVQTYNCMNTETKDNKLILVRHLKEPPFVDPNPSILQPLENPTMSEPYSVYPLVYCCSEVGKINESDAMYILKCLVESKVKDPFYSIISPQGICVSEIEGLLPNRSPSIFEIAIELLDIPQTLVESEDSVVSREAYQICKGLRDGESVINLINNYGWTVAKKEKEKDVMKDDQFWIFKGKRKEEGPFGEQYSLAWFSKFGLAKFKYIDLTKDGYEPQFYQDYLNKIEFYRNNEQKAVNTIEVFKYIKQTKGIKLFLEILNQGTLSDYISRRQQLGKPLSENTAIPMLDSLAASMKQLRLQPIKSHGALHSKILYVHNHKIVIGQPLLVTDKIEKKLRELKTTFDFYAPEMKENIILPENLFKLDFQKMDIWSFGFILHKVITKELPAFDPTRKPVLNKSYFSPGMLELISKCLSLTPSNRPSWNDINIKDLASAVVVQDVEEPAAQKEVIRLGTSKEMASEKSVKLSKSKINNYEQIKEEASQKAEKQMREEEEEKLKEKQQEDVIPIPVQLSLRLKKIKLIAKIIIIMVLYIFVFFRDFLGNSISILLVRSYYGTTSLNLVDNSNNVLSTTVIITDQPNYFLLNDISFSDIQNKYSCINNQFNPVYDPTYSLLTYVQSPSFLALLLTGWLAIILICATKAISIWKGGISNRPTKNMGKYMVIYIFHELSLASLLFAHFYIYQFFYFAGGKPCFSIQSYIGIQPFFDSSLYLFLLNSSGYLTNIFSSLGILGILVLLSTCYYAWGPKLDQKYFLSVPSILFRIIPYILLILICRIGVFMVFSPTAINDSSKMLPAIIAGSADGFFGIIPQVFIIICVTTQVLLQLFFYWCERKAATSDKLARLFNLRQKKVSTLEESNAHLNEMSMLSPEKSLGKENSKRVNNGEMFD